MLDLKEKARRRALRRAKAYDYNCDTCSAHAGYPCQSTGRARRPGVALAVAHVPRMKRARGYLVVHNWTPPGTNTGDTKLETELAREMWDARTA